jgi:hypothetical protein
MLLNVRKNTLLVTNQTVSDTGLFSVYAGKIRNSECKLFDYLFDKLYFYQNETLIA